MKKQLFAILGGGISGFLYGWIVYGMLLMDFMQNNMTEYPGLMKEESPMMIVGYLLSNLAVAFILTMVYHKWASISTFKSGLINGLILGALFIFSIDIQFFTGMNLFTGQSLVVDVLAGAGMYGVTGGVAALILGKVKD
jgi:hypothetical protein